MPASHKQREREKEGEGDVFVCCIHRTHVLCMFYSFADGIILCIVYFVI